MRASRLIQPVARPDRGVSAVEATVLVTMLAALAAMVSPVILASIDDARQSQVRSDLGVLATGLEVMLNDAGESFVLRRGHGAAETDAPSRTAANQVSLLVTGGDVPAIVRNVMRASGVDWNAPVDGRRVMSFHAQLVANSPEYRSPAQMTGLVPFDPASGSSHTGGFGWRGAYLTPNIGADPWGQRYAANVEFLGRRSSSPGSPSHSYGVMVLSAGPNGRIDTPFAASPATSGGDDFTVVVSSP